MQGTPIQESFQNGEISRNVRGRVSSDIYKQALKYCENWVPQIQGPIRTRDGFQYSGDIDPRNTEAVLFTFSVGLDNDFIVEVGDNWVIVRHGITGEQITGGVSVNLVTDPTYQSEFTFWTLDNAYTGTSGIGTLGAVPVTFQHLDNSISLTSRTNPNFTSGGVPVDEGARGHEIRQLVTVPPGTDILQHNFLISDIFNLMSANEILDMEEPFDDAEITIRVGTTEFATDIHFLQVPVTVAGIQSAISTNFIPGAGVTSYWLGIGVRWDGLNIPPPSPFTRGPDIFDDMEYRIGPVRMTTALPGGSAALVEFASPYTVADLICMHSAMDPGERELWITSDANSVEPYQLKFDGAAWTFLDVTSVAGFTPPVPNTWVANSWPSRVSIRDGRLVLANIPSQRSTIWGSRAGDYPDFDASTPTAAADPLLFPLSVAGVITGLTNKKQLIINTDVSEVVGVSSNPGNVLTFDDFGFPLQTEWGSSCVQPVGVGREVIFVSPDGRKLRTFADEGGTNFGWDGLQLNLLAEDLFGTRVIEMDWADDPSYQFLCVMGNGEITAATYYQKQESVGFYRLTTDGSIKTITVVNTSRGTVVWAFIERDGVWRLEQLPFASGDKHALDSWVHVNVDNAGVVTGLDHLDGMDCSIVLKSDDPGTGTTYWTILPNATPVAGSITIESSVAFDQMVYVGLRYNNSIQLLDLEGLSHSGTSQGSKRRWAKVFLRLIDSAVPLVEGQYPWDRSPSTPMGLGEPFVTGDVEVVDLGSGEGDIVITQDRPLISEIAAIFGKATGNQA